jgi:hypothetical protein
MFDITLHNKIPAFAGITNLTSMQQPALRIIIGAMEIINTLPGL